MELEKQVCSLELAKKLKELGVKQDSLWWFIFDNTHTSSLRVSDKDQSHHTWAIKSRWWDGELFNRLSDNDKISAFSVAELGEMLPARIKGDEGIIFDLEYWENNTSWQVSYWWEEDTRHLGDLKIETFNADTEVDARAKMLIYLLENQLVQASTA